MKGVNQKKDNNKKNSSEALLLTIVGFVLFFFLAGVRVSTQMYNTIQYRHRYKTLVLN